MNSLITNNMFWNNSWTTQHKQLQIINVSCLCLLDLFYTFDTTEHNILIAHLSSWFGIQGSVLNWFESYLTSRSFRVKRDKDFFSEHISSCGVPQGSVLGPLLFIMYTTTLSSLISSLSLNHHLYADDTQLFSHSIHVTFTQVSPTSRPLCNRFPPGCPQIFLLLTLPRLNFSLLVSKGNFLK